MQIARRRLRPSGAEGLTLAAGANAGPVRLLKDRQASPCRGLSPWRVCLGDRVLRLGDFGMGSQRFRELVEADIRERELIPPGGAVTCLVSGGADCTSPAQRSASLATRSPRCTSTTACADASLTRTPRSAAKCSAPRSSTDVRGQHGGRVARAALLVRHRPAARHRPHRVRPGGNRPLPARLEWHARLDQVAARGRSRRLPSAAPVRRPRPTAGWRASTTARTPPTPTRSAA